MSSLSVIDFYAAHAVMNIHGLLLAIPSDLRYVTLNQYGQIKGYTYQPYFDEEDKDWTSYDGKVVQLVQVHVNDDVDFSILFEV